MKRIAFAMMLLLAPSPAAADPISDLIASLFRPHAVALHPSNIGLRNRVRVRQRQMEPKGATMLASFYGGGPRKYEPNSHTANGERFNQWGLTAAHRTLPFETRLRVCYRGCKVVRINDRGPALWTGRSLDISRGAAAAIGMLGIGVARVRVAIVR